MRDIVNTSGTVIDHVVYDSYGNILTESNAGNGDRFKFAGMEWDAAIGQYYDHARWYGPQVGSFTEQDPLGFATDNTNLYSYVSNKPTDSLDQSGLSGGDDGDKPMTMGAPRGPDDPAGTRRNPSSKTWKEYGQQQKELEKQQQQIYRDLKKKASEGDEERPGRDNSGIQSGSGSASRAKQEYMNQAQEALEEARSRRRQQQEQEEQYQAEGSWSMLNWIRNYLYQDAQNHNSTPEETTSQGVPNMAGYPILLAPLPCPVTTPIALPSLPTITVPTITVPTITVPTPALVPVVVY